MEIEVVLSILVGVLSALVTALVVYQIVNVIVFEKRLSKFKKEIREAYKKELNKVGFDASGLAIAQLGLALYNNEDYSNSIQALINALSCLNGGDKESESNKEAITETVDLLYKISLLIDTGTIHGFTQEVKTNCYIMISNVEDKVKQKAILRLIDSFRVDDTNS